MPQHTEGTTDPAARWTAVSGLTLLEDERGSGKIAARGSSVVYNARFYLRRGEEVTHDHQSIRLYGKRLNTRLVEDTELIDHQTVLGRRQSIAAVEKSIYGMQAGGYREVLASPHLCYGEKGVVGSIPARAMLRIQLWVRTVA